MKLVIYLFLSTLLIACSVPATADSGSGSDDAVSDDANTESAVSEADLTGFWSDANAIMESCGLRSPVFVSLELVGDVEALGGQLTLASREFPFEGSARADTVTGLVSTLDGSSLSADLTLRNGRLRGTFSAADEVVCRDGARSRTVYEVALGR